MSTHTSKKDFSKTVAFVGGLDYTGRTTPTTGILSGVAQTAVYSVAANYVGSATCVLDSANPTVQKTNQVLANVIQTLVEKGILNGA